MLRKVVGASASTSSPHCCNDTTGSASCTAASLLQCYNLLTLAFTPLQMPFMLCCTAAGSEVCFFALGRDDGRLLKIGGPWQLNTIKVR